MHAYQIDEPVRTRIFLLSATASVLISIALDTIARALNVNPPLWLDYPSVFGVFALVVALYNRYLWNRWPFNSTTLFRIPDIAGRWALAITSSHDEFRTPISAMLLIRQTGSRMSAAIESEESTSYSLSASLLPQERFLDFELTYHYVNTPRPSAPSTMVPHQGLAILRFSLNPTQLEGEYFSGRGRHNHGSFAATRVPQAA